MILGLNLRAFGKKSRFSLFVTTLFILIPCSRAQQPAFPEAQGGGAASVGGRGGVVREVTNLEDSGEGSLRACIDESGPRTCVFRIAGMITQHKDLIVSHPFLTIAGQ